MEQLGSRLRKEYDGAVCHHSVCLTYALTASWEMPGWMSYKLESREARETSTTSDMQMIPLWWQKVKRTKKPLDEGEGGEGKSRLKTKYYKTKIMASSPITAWQVEGEKVEVVTDCLFLGSKITADGDCSHEIRRHLFPDRKAMTNLTVCWKVETLLCWQSSV